MRHYFLKADDAVSCIEIVVRFMNQGFKVRLQMICRLHKKTFCFQSLMIFEIQHCGDGAWFQVKREVKSSLSEDGIHILWLLSCSWTVSLPLLISRVVIRSEASSWNYLSFQAPWRVYPLHFLVASTLYPRIIMYLGHIQHMFFWLGKIWVANNLLK